jgi:hypothetical protein
VFDQVLEIGIEAFLGIGIEIGIELLGSIPIPTKTSRNVNDLHHFG